MKMILKVILAENNKIQIKWAEKIFKNDKLIICRTGKEWENYNLINLEKNKEKIDLLITELFLPFKKGEKPTASVGLKVFLTSLALYKEERIKKVALVSDYEHRINKEKLSSSEETYLKCFRSVLNILKTNFDIYFAFDFPLENYDYFADPQGGKILNKEKIQKKFRNKKYIPELEAIKRGYIPLKPYHIIRRAAELEIKGKNKE